MSSTCGKTFVAVTTFAPTIGRKRFIDHVRTEKTARKPSGNPPLRRNPPPRGRFHPHPRQSHVRITREQYAVIAADVHYDIAGAGASPAAPPHRRSASGGIMRYCSAPWKRRPDTRHSLPKISSADTTSSNLNQAADSRRDRHPGDISFPMRLVRPQETVGGRLVAQSDRKLDHPRGLAVAAGGVFMGGHNGGYFLGRVRPQQSTIARPPQSIVR